MKTIPLGSDGALLSPALAPHHRDRLLQLVETFRDVSICVGGLVERSWWRVANASAADLVRQAPHECLVTDDQDEQHDRPYRHGPLKLQQQSAPERQPGYGRSEPSATLTATATTSEPITSTGTTADRRNAPTGET
jgi:hypothetical protein